MLRASPWLSAWPTSTSEEIRVDPGLRTRDRDRPDRLRVEVRRTSPADDRVGVALGGHGQQRHKEERGPDAPFSLAFEHARGSEEPLRGRVVAREAQDVLTALRAEARDREPGEADVALAGPTLAEVFADPGDNDMPFRREGASHLDAIDPQRLDRGGLGKVVEADEHVVHAGGL